jgi:hypothetical protein
MGELEGRARRLSRRADRIEEEIEFRERRKQLEAERVFRKAIKRVSPAELEAMGECLNQSDREDWGEEDEPLMRRLLVLVEEVRAEEAAGDFPWRAEMNETRGVEPWQRGWRRE